MKKVLASLFFGLLFLVFASGNSYSEIGSSKGKIEKGMHEECNAAMGGMKYHHMEMMRRGHHIWRSLMGLGLDENQKGSLKEIMGGVRKDSIRKRADLQIARIELKDILDKDQVDMNAAEVKLKQLESLKTDMRLAHLKAMEEIKAKLTPEQRDKFKKALKKHRRWQGRWMHGCKRMTPHGDKKGEMKPEMEHRHN